MTIIVPDNAKTTYGAGGSCTTWTEPAEPRYVVNPRSNWMDRAPLRHRVLSSVRSLLSGPKRKSGLSASAATVVSAETGLGLNPGDTVEHGASVKPSSTRDIKPDTTSAGWKATEVCPDWCQVEHDENDPRNLHSHYSDFADLPLCHDDGNSINGFSVPTIVLDMSHEHETTEPRIQLDCDSDRHWVDMTPDEAESVALHLLDMVKAAKAGMRAAGAPCDHVWPIRATNTLAKPADCSRCGLPFDQRRIGAKVEQQGTEITAAR